MKGKYEKVTPPEELEQSTDSDSKTSDNKKTKDKKSSKKTKSSKTKNVADIDETESTIDVESEYVELLELKKDLTKKFHKNPKSKVLKKRIAECCEDIKKLVKDARKSNTKEYKKLIVGESKKPNEMNYFKTKLSNAEQLRVMRELKEVNEFMGVDKPYRLALLDSNIPPKLKANAMQKINMLRSMDNCDPEYFKIKNWVDTFMRIPFCKYSNLTVSMADGLDKCHEFMSNAKNVLDKCVYGLDDAKLQILQMIGQWISNPDAMGTAIAIKGPPGTGKTTLVKDGISKILGREFVFIPLGGAGDASYLEGHSYTYEGSSWGKIVQSLIDAKCMNPVFYFDELDKISDTPKGEEITGILTHMTDTTQNSQYHDKYFSDVDFDLSKCLFIFSYNDESKVNPILKDRMYRIQTKGYDSKEKIVIANQYMLPKIREQVNFKAEDIVIPDDTIKYIVSAQHLTQKEDGVRNMKRCLEIIHTKLNLFRLVKPDENMFAKDIDMKVQFPFTVDTKAVDVLIKNEEKQSQSLLSMYI
jgi:ATP-dependent Lon protease